VGRRRGARVRDHGDTRLLAFDGERWRSNPALIPSPVSAVWGDHETVLVAGRVGTVFWLEQGSWRLEDPGTLEHFTSVWGRARNDVWAGTAQGNVLHYDGVSWTPIGKLGGVTCEATLPITGIWGSGDDVHFHSDAQLARWNGSKLQSIANW
jgi:hypothetical protein